MSVSEFWITNITKMNVSLTDLGLTVKSRSSVNLLDSRHYHLTIEQLEASAKNGSLFKKSDRVKVRTVAPKPIIAPGLYVANDYRPTIKHTSIEVVETHFEELEISDEVFAAEFIESEEDL